MGVIWEIGAHSRDGWWGWLHKCDYVPQGTVSWLPWWLLLGSVVHICVPAMEGWSRRAFWTHIRVCSGSMMKWWNCLFVCLFVCFWDRVSSCSSSCPGTHYEDQATSDSQRSACFCSWVLESKQIAENTVMYFKFKMWKPILYIRKVTKLCLEMQAPDLRFCWALHLGYRQDETWEAAQGYPMPEDRMVFLCFFCIWFISLTMPSDLASQSTWEKVLAPLMDKESVASY